MEVRRNPMNEHSMKSSEGKYSREAEEALIGSLLVEPERFPSIAAFLTGDDFYFEEHQILWDAMAYLQQLNQTFDLVAVVMRLGATLAGASTQAVVLNLMMTTPTPVHAEIYGHMIERCATARRSEDAE